MNKLCEQSDCLLTNKNRNIVCSQNKPVQKFSSPPDRARWSPADEYCNQKSSST